MIGCLARYRWAKKVKSIFPENCLRETGHRKLAEKNVNDYADQQLTGETRDGRLV
jgi:hypothetical protein